MLDFPVRKTFPKLEEIYAKRAEPKRKELNDLKNKFSFEKVKFSNLSKQDQLLFEKFGAGPVVSLPFSNIHHAFEARVAAAPEAVAADHLGNTVTYGELDRQANRLAAKLAQHGVSNGDAVALFVRRSVPMLVGIMASLKTGACYVPQDVKVAPEPQLRHVATVTGSNPVTTIFTEQFIILFITNQNII